MQIRKTLACNMLAHFQDMGKWRSYLFVRSAHTILTVGVAASLLVKDTELRDALVRFDDLSSQAIQRGFYVLAFFSLTIAALVMYYVTCLVDPGFVPLNIIEQEDEDAEESEAMLADTEESGVPLRRCGFCGIKQPLRARHCEDCQRCVRKYDHHCPWLDRCIGENNHKYFLLFLALKSVVIIWAALIVWRAFVWRPLWIEWLTTNMVFLLDLVILLPSGVAVSLLFFMHLYVALVNQTTWEIVSRERITYLKKLDVEVNPFHMGYIHNCLHFLFDCQAQRWDIIYKKYSSSPGYVESPV